MSEGAGNVMKGSVYIDDSTYTVEKIKAYRDNLKIGDSVKVKMDIHRSTIADCTCKEKQELAVMPCLILKKYPHIVIAFNGIKEVCLTYLDLMRGSNIYNARVENMYG